MASAAVSPGRRAAVDALVADLRRVFGNRLLSVSVYGVNRGADEPTRTLVLVDSLTFEDLAACVPLARNWEARDLAVPLLLEEDEFIRTLDVFPIEYGDILAHHAVVAGSHPFENLTVAPADLRRACEQQAKSHLIHLRESFLESRGEPRAVARLIAASAEPFRRLLENLVTLMEPAARQIDHDRLPEKAGELLGIPAELTREILAVSRAEGASAIADPTALLAEYVAAVDRIWALVDEWKHR